MSNEALARALGDQAAGQWQVAAAGCEFGPCTSVVTRYAVFVRALPSSEAVQRREQVTCSGRKEANWLCAERETVATLMLDTQRHDVRLIGELPDTVLLDVARFVRSPCLRAAIDASRDGPGVPEWMKGRLPIREIARDANLVELEYGHSGGGLRLSLRENQGNQACRYLVVHARPYIS